MQLKTQLAISSILFNPGEEGREWGEMRLRLGRSFHFEERNQSEDDFHLKSPILFAKLMKMVPLQTIELLGIC